MTKGKYLEKLISLIEEVIKEHDFISVLHDQHMTDKNGRKRQIDVLVESDWGRLGKQSVIIECKNWNKRVEIGDVEAFITKIESLSVSKGIIVSNKGFQKGAIDTANGSQRVELYTLEELNKIEIENSLEIPIFKFGYQIIEDKELKILNTPAKCTLNVNPTETTYFKVQNQYLEINNAKIEFMVKLFFEKTDSIKLKSYKEINKKHYSELYSVNFEDSTLEVIENKNGEKRYFEIMKSNSEVYEYHMVK